MPDGISPRNRHLDHAAYQPLSKPPGSKASKAAAPILTGQPSQSSPRPLALKKPRTGGTDSPRSVTSTYSVAQKFLKRRTPEERGFVSCAPHSLAKSTARIIPVVPRSPLPTPRTSHHRSDSLLAAAEKASPRPLTRPTITHTPSPKKSTSATRSSYHPEGRSVARSTPEKPGHRPTKSTPFNEVYRPDLDDDQASSHRDEGSPPLELRASHGSLSPSALSVCGDLDEAKQPEGDPRAAQLLPPAAAHGVQLPPLPLSMETDSLDIDGLNGLFTRLKPMESALGEPPTPSGALTDRSYSQRKVLLPPEAIASFPFPVERPIRKLEFSQVDISDEQLGVLAERLKESLEGLELVMCERVRDAGIRSLRCLKRLLDLTLNSCSSITTQGMAALLTSDACRRLRSLCLVNVEVTQQLYDAVFRLAELQHLELSCSEGLSDEHFLSLGRLPRLKTLVVSELSLSTETLSKFRTLYPLITLMSSFQYTLPVEQQLPAPAPLLPNAAATVATSVGVQRPAYQFLRDFVAAVIFGNVPFEPEQLEYQLNYVLQNPGTWVDAVAAFYAQALNDRHLDCFIPIIPENWLAIEQKLQEYRPVRFIFMAHFVALKYQVNESVVFNNLNDYAQPVTQFYEGALKEREVEYDFPITPDTWIHAEQLLQAAYEKPILKVFVDIFIAAGFCETQFSEGVPQNLKDLYDLLLMRGDMRKKIRSLDFDNCQLIHLALPILYIVFENLEEARFTRNQIRQIPEFFRVGGEKLNKLFLGSNLIDSLPDNFGEDYPNLSELHLENNRFTKVPRLAYNNFQALILNLENNQIEVISDEDLEMISQLPITIVIDLTGNPVCDHPDRLKQYQKKCPQIMVRVSLLAPELQVPVYVS